MKAGGQRGPGLETRPSLRVVLSVLVLGSVLQAVSSAIDQSDWKARIDRKTVARIHRILETETASGTAARSLAALGAGELPSLCAVLWELPEGASRPSGAPGDSADTTEPLSDSRLMALRRAIRAIPSASRSTFLASVANAEDASTRDRLRCVDLLALIGQSPDLDLMLEIAGTVGPIGFQAPMVRTSLRRALGTFLARERRAPARLVTRWRGLGGALRGIVIEAAAEHPDPRMMEMLEVLLGTSGRLDAFVARTLADLSRRTCRPFSRACVMKLRGLLRGDSKPLRRVAASVLGAAHDTDSLEDLINLLSCSDRQLVRACHESLRTLTGMSLPAEGPAWREWHELQQEWKKRELAELVKQLRSDRPEEVVRAIRSACGRRLFRATLVPELTALLRAPEPGVRQAACAALGMLGDPESARDLLEVLQGDRNESVRHAAWQALTGITGLRLAPDPAAWSRALCDRP